ncbi:hypothetical protein [Clostridium estertheticum]|uniref:hypothetical protein n=2 Tax=Clostridium estertheticum TaxID=238834 RepID=UPI002714F544|nr:hypothetical protein [Clostridium estertheticum]WLC82419.1 hypothetical protein KTC98_24140 [Clostridium estertheticum]
MGIKGMTSGAIEKIKWSGFLQKYNLTDTELFNNFSVSELKELLTERELDILEKRIKSNEQFNLMATLYNVSASTVGRVFNGAIGKLRKAYYLKTGENLKISVLDVPNSTYFYLGNYAPIIADMYPPKTNEMYFNYVFKAKTFKECEEYMKSHDILYSFILKGSEIKYILV